VDHGVVEIFAYQETLLLMAVFGIAILAMIWVAFRRWLQHRERLDQLIAEQAAERTAQFGAQLVSVEARLKAVEEIVADPGGGPLVQIKPRRTNPALISNPDKV